MSIVRIGLAENKGFATGYDAIFKKKSSKPTAPVAVKTAAAKPAKTAAKAAAKAPVAKPAVKSASKKKVAAKK
jgi:uncharacterized metal-binding protein